MRTRLAAVAVLLATALPIGAGYAFDAAHAKAPVAPLGPGLAPVKLDMRYSRFSIEDIRVYQGTLVRFEVTNSDPIHHEFIIGSDLVHDSHETGHDKFHPPVPGEVSVKPEETGLTTYLFDKPGDVQFACHLKGHFSFGMVGRVTVIPA